VGDDYSYMDAIIFCGDGSSSNHLTYARLEKMSLIPRTKFPALHFIWMSPTNHRIWQGSLNEDDLNTSVSVDSKLFFQVKSMLVASTDSLFIFS
jgi:hypothetical protein